MEPEKKYYKPFIEPLLKAPGSAFRHTVLSGAHPKSYWESYDHIFKNADLIPTRKPLKPGDPQFRQPNDTLLVTGTLSRRYSAVRGHVNNVHNSNLLLNHMVQAAQTNSLFHSYGLVRMLFWLPEDTRPMVLPDSATTRAGFTLGLETSAEMIELAGRDRASVMAEKDLTKRSVYKYRNPEMEQVGAERVLRSMEDRGIQIPVHRRGSFHQEAIRRKEAGEGLTEVEADQIDYLKLKESASVETAIASHEAKLQQYMSASSGLTMHNREGYSLPYTYRFPSVFSKLLRAADKSRLGPYIELCGTQLALEMELVKTRPKTPVALWEEQRSRLAAVSAGLRELLGKIVNTTKHGTAQIFLGELLAFNSKLLQFDRRPFEPLALQADEFWPQFPMYLVDVQPNPDNLASDIASATVANSALREIITNLFQIPATPIPAALDRLGPDAAQALLPSVPEAFDVAQGGRLNPDDLAVRMLTAEMVRSLTRAYLEWPFRPSAYEGADMAES
ncbi:hypothetical protein MBLNU459_g0015t1 [Dothideomycetes sp. NU459]